MSTIQIILTLLFFVVSVALVLIVLVQRPQGGGLTGAFGGGAGTDERKDADEDRLLRLEGEAVAGRDLHAAMIRPGTRPPV